MTVQSIDFLNNDLLIKKHILIFEYQIHDSYYVIMLSNLLREMLLLKFLFALKIQS